MTMKPVVLATIGLALAGIVTGVNTGLTAITSEIKKSNAMMEAAQAAMQAAKAESEKAAAMLEAARSTLESARVQAAALMGSSFNVMRGTITAADLQARGQVASATQMSRADNEQLDQFLKPLILDPANKMAGLNGEIVRLRRETQNRTDQKTRRMLSDAEIADKTAERLAREEDLATLKETAGKNVTDFMAVAMSTLTQGFGGTGNLYPNANNTSASVRKINEEP